MDNSGPEIANQQHDDGNNGTERTPDPRRFRFFARPRQRRTVLLGILCALLVALVVVLATAIPQARDTLGGIISRPTATPTATLAPGDPVVYFENLAPWGTLTVNGKPLAPRDTASPPSSTPASGTGSYDNVLPRGRNTIEYDADPWPPLHCVLMVPATLGTSTCPVVQPDSDQSVVMVYGARLVDLGATIGQLPPAALASLKSAVAHLVGVTSAPAAVRPGEHYLTANGTLATANQPLLATLYRELWGGTGQDPWYHCGALCGAAWAGQLQPDVWTLSAVVVEGYTYTTLGGTLVAANGPVMPSKVAADSVGYPAWQDNIAVKWSNGAWQVSTGDLSHDPLSCNAEGWWVGGVYGLKLGGPGPHDEGEWAAPHEAGGCVMKVQVLDSMFKPKGPTMYLLYRFGRLLVVNQAAASYYPDLPYANAYEVALAQQIIARHS